MEVFEVNDGIRHEEIEAMDETEATMVFIEKYDLAPREHDFVRATRQGAERCRECNGLGRIAVADAEHGPEFDTVEFCQCVAGQRVRDRDRRSGKPRCQLTGENGNVFAVIARVRRCLEEDGQPERAKEFVQRATKSKSYDAVLQLTFEYVDPM